MNDNPILTNGRMPFELDTETLVDELNKSSFELNKLLSSVSSAKDIPEDHPLITRYAALLRERDKRAEDVIRKLIGKS